MSANIDGSVWNTTSLVIEQTRLAMGCILETIRESSIGIYEKKLIRIN